MFSKWMLSVFDFLREMNTFHVFVRFRVSLLCFEHIWIEGCPITIKNRTSETRSDRRLSVNPKNRTSTGRTCGTKKGAAASVRGSSS